MMFSVFALLMNLARARLRVRAAVRALIAIWEMTDDY